MSTRHVLITGVFMPFKALYRLLVVFVNHAMITWGPPVDNMFVHVLRHPLSQSALDEHAPPSLSDKMPYGNAT